MTTLKFTDTHNMVAFLSKPAESEGFEQIMDFLNAQPIRYALTVNPTIYTSCIAQFWATVKAKTVNGEVQLQALVDGKKIIITQSTVTRDIQLKDAEGVDCLPNATIFEQLALMGYEKLSQKLTFYKAFFSPQWKFFIHTILQCLSSKTTAWNEFSSTMASAIICLATNQKFNFSKYIFESMVKNLDNLSGNFLMYPRFVQVFLNQQLDGMPTHKRIYDAPSHTKKIFGNMKRVGKDNVADEAVNEEMDDNLERAATTATSLDAEQDRGNIVKTQSKATLNEPSSPGTSSGSGPRRQKTMGDTIAQTRFENVSKLSNDPLLAREFGSSRRVESSEDEGLGEEDASKQGRIADIDANKDIYLVNVHTDEDMFGVNDLDGDEVIVDNVDVVKTAEETRSMVEEVTAIIEKAKLVSAAEEIVNVAATTVSITNTIPVSDAATTTTRTVIPDDEITLAKALAELKSAKPPTQGIAFKNPRASTYTNSFFTTTITGQGSGQGLDEELAFKLQAEEEEERLAREKAQQIEEANIAWDDVQAKIEADYQLAQRLQAQEQEELTAEEKARLLVQFLEQRRKYFAAKRVEEKMSRPPTRSQQRSIMVNTFADYRTELVEESSKKTEIELEENSKKAKAEIAQESSSKRAGEELEQESSKKQKVEEDKESEELKQCLDIVPDDGDDVTINATHLSIKAPTIVDYKIYKEGKKSYFQIIKADGKSQMYLTFGKMHKNFDRGDLEVLWSIVKARFKKTEPVNYMDNLLLHHLKTVFEHHVEDNSMLFYLLVEKIYPLTNHTLHQMFNDVKLQVDYECEMAFELLRLVKKQLKEDYGRIVGIKRLLDDLRVIAAQLMMLVYKLLLLVLKVNAASTKVTTAQRLRLLKEFLLIGHIARKCTQPKRPQNSEYFKDKMLLMQAQENEVALDEEQLFFIAGGQDNVVYKDVDEQPTMFMENLSTANPACDEASPSYDSDILSKVPDHDNYQDAVYENHEVHEIHDNVQPIYVVDSHADYTSDNNIILYDLYVKDNTVPVVQSNVSSVPNDAYMMILNDMLEQSIQCVSVTTQNNVVDKSLTAELVTYKEQVELYQRQAKFDLTKREQKIDEQLRIVITDRNIKEEKLKMELHSIKLQLNSTINHNKSMVEEVEDRLFKQDQSLQTVHMLCKPKPYYDEQKKVEIGYTNPLYLTRAKQVQPALYNGHEIIKTHHVPAIVHDFEDTLEIAEITRKKINNKMKTPLWTEQNINIRPPDYSKENYMANFTPQTQLTPSQIFWSKDLLKMKAEALKEQTTASRPIKALTVYPPNTPATLVPRYDEIERKTLLIANDNLIVDCLSKEVFYIAANSELTVSRFTKMHDAHTVVQARCLELKVELSKLHDKI
ncbi:hypothetical protein Tco_0504845 [Tanacetum coccineum]